MSRLVTHGRELRPNKPLQTDSRAIVGALRALYVGATLLLTVAVIACVVPMLRATGVDPAIAVRVE